MLLFVHDHKFRRVNGKIYSTGGLNNEVLQRYLHLDDTLCVYARIIDENHTLNQWSIIHDKYKIYGDCTLSGNDLDALIKKTDGVIVRLPSFLGLKACKLAKHHKKPIMIEVVGCAWDSLVNHGIKGKIIAPYCYLKTKHYVKYAPFVLYVTEQYLQNRYPTDGHSISCSDVEIDQIVNSNKTYCCTPINKYIIGTIGAVDVRYKGQEYVIEALRILKDMNITNYVYHLVGNGDSSYLKGVAAKFGVEDRVVFCGGLPHEKVFSWLDSIDIYIQPSQTEGLPRALIEAESRGLPCLGSRIGGIPELLQESAIFDIKKRPAQNIANIIAKLSKNTLSEMSTHSLEVAFRFDRSSLEKRRSVFYHSFYKYVLDLKVRK